MDVHKKILLINKVNLSLSLYLHNTIVYRRRLTIYETTVTIYSNLQTTVKGKYVEAVFESSLLHCFLCILITKYVYQ